MVRTKLAEMLKRHEGLRLLPYKDTVGKLTIGYGRNIEDVGISKQEAEFMLQGDMYRGEEALKNALPFFESLDEVRQDVLIDMAFMGIKKLLGFVKMLDYIRQGIYDHAAIELLNSTCLLYTSDAADE